MLSEINGGATAIPVEGGWVDNSGQIILEQPVIVYSLIKTEPFVSNLQRVWEFLHRMGRETNQGENAFEIDGQFQSVRHVEGHKENEKLVEAIARKLVASVGIEHPG